MKVKVQMNSVNQILREHGLDRDGYAQMHWTEIVNGRISRYMPYRSGALTSMLEVNYAPAPGKKQYISGAAPRITAPAVPQRLVRIKGRMP